MSIINENKIISMMRDLYAKRLSEAMNEMDIFDSRGNMVLGKDTKVTHKDTGFEYTVADVQNKPGSKDAKIVLRLPDQPRVDPQEEEEVISDEYNKSFLGEQDQETVEGEDDEVVFVIDKDDFEKNYEVE